MMRPSGVKDKLGSLISQLSFFIEVYKLQSFILDDRITIIFPNVVKSLISTLCLVASLKAQ